MMRRDGQRAKWMLGHTGQYNRLRRGEQGWEMVMVRESAAVIRKTAIGMVLGLRRRNAHLTGRILVEVERSEELEANVPNEDEKQKSGASPPMKRQRLGSGHAVFSSPKQHGFHLPMRLT